MTNARLAGGGRMGPAPRPAARSRRAALLLAALCGAAACGRGGPAPAPDAAGTPGAAEAVTAAVFPLAREPGGVRVALDSLRAHVARDAGLRPQGHHLAHALGRFAVAERGNLSVLPECTPAFQSGCIHGVLEGFFRQGGTADPASIGGICREHAAPGQPGYALLECWHGLGHGLMAQFSGDVRRALPLCDALETPTARRECRDGAFMERVVAAVGPAAEGAGGPGGGHAHGAHGGAAPSAPSSDAALRQLCEGLEARHQPSCWLYQPAVLVRIHGLDGRAVLRACDAAPAAAVRDCYRGFGKMHLAATSGNARAMIRACGKGDRSRATDCLLGGAEYFTDLEWTIEPGIAFCRQVPGHARAACYGLIGRRLALIHPDPERAASACQGVERGHVRACLVGVGER